MKLKIETLYLSFFNDFLTLYGFAEYYGISVDRAERIVNAGRILNHRRPTKNKEN